MSFVLNLFSCSMVIPNLALAGYFLAVTHIPLVLRSLWRSLDWLPEEAFIPVVICGALALVIILAIAIAKSHVVLPALVILLGTGSLIFVCWAAGPKDTLQSPFVWCAAVGVVLSGLQLWRSITSVAG